MPKTLARRPDIVVAYARSLMACDDYESAEAALRESIERSWDESTVLTYGELEMEEPFRVLERAESWLPEHPEDAALLLTCAHLAMRAELYGKARTYLETSIAIRPRLDAYQLLASLMEQLGERERALSSAQRRTRIRCRTQGEGAEDSRPPLAGSPSGRPEKVMPYSRITLLPAQQVIFVEEGETILDAALRAGLNLPHSCKGGHCSSCRARIRSGRIVYPRGRPLGLLAEEEREGYALLCQAHATGADVSVEVREIRPPRPEVQVKSLPCRIERMHKLAPEVMAVFLRLPAHEDFHFFPGQYLDIMLPQNRRRSFSIASVPGREQLIELHIRKVASGEFTQQLFDGMKEKTLLRIEGPLGQFWFRRESPRPALLIGGGTGYAPLRSMLRDLLEVGDRRPLHLYWGAQLRQDLYEDEQVRALTAAYPNLRYTPVLSDAQAEDGWTGRRGLVHAAALEDHPQLQERDVYASGPPAMVEAVRHDFIARGLPAQQLFFDSFDYAPDVLAKLDASAARP